MTASIESGVDALLVAGSMTIDNAAALLKNGCAALSAKNGVFDLTAVTEIDSSGLAVLFGWQRLALAQNKTLRIQNPPRNLINLATMYGVGELLSLT